MTLAFALLCAWVSNFCSVSLNFAETFFRVVFFVTVVELGLEIIRNEWA